MVLIDHDGLRRRIGFVCVSVICFVEVRRIKAPTIAMNVAEFENLNFVNFREYICIVDYIGPACHSSTINTLVGFILVLVQSCLLPEELAFV